MPIATNWSSRFACLGALNARAGNLGKISVATRECNIAGRLPTICRHPYRAPCLMDLPDLNGMCVLQVLPALDSGGVERGTIDVAVAIARAAGGLLSPHQAAP